MGEHAETSKSVKNLNKLERTNLSLNIEQLGLVFNLFNEPINEIDLNFDMFIKSHKNSYKIF
jgi:hypothetical protein